MTTETKVTHTPGALRAALLFDEQLVAAGLPSDYLSKRSRIEAVAAKIDQETAAPDMLEALEQVDELATRQIQGGTPEQCHTQLAQLRGLIHRTAQAVIAKAKGGAA